MIKRFDPAILAAMVTLQELRRLDRRPSQGPIRHAIMPVDDARRAARLAPRTTLRA